MLEYIKVIEHQGVVICYFTTYRWFKREKIFK